MALTLISRTARRVGVAMTADGGLFYPDADYKALSVNTGHPARIMPPRGVWTVTVSGAAVTGVTPAIGQADILATNGEVKFTRYYTGSESMLVKTNTTGATCTVVLEEAPPLRKCVLARLGVAPWR